LSAANVAQLRFMKQVLNDKAIALIIKRLAYQIVEDHPHCDDIVFIGIQPRGVQLSERLMVELNALYGKQAAYGILDITFYRDDFRKEIMVPNQTHLDMSLENKEVILIDDVLYTGRTTRAALDALLDFGRPSKVTLCTLIDRKFNREIPIQPDYTGKTIDTIFSQKVVVHWKENDGVDEVRLLG
jgi:Pyrimidine operon attenuation protein/uracil phosphoribosyltransferase